MENKQEIIAQWVDQFTAELLAWALAKTPDRALAEDLVQDTFLAAAESWEGFQGRSRPRTWLFSILRNKIADHYRRQAARPALQQLPPDDLNAYFDEAGEWRQSARPGAWAEDPEQLLLDRTFRENLRKCLAGLPEPMRAALTLTYLEGKKGPDVSQELGLSASNYWQIMRRARLQLRDCVEKNS